MLINTKTQNTLHHCHLNANLHLSYAAIFGHIQ